MVQIIKNNILLVVAIVAMAFAALLIPATASAAVEIGNNLKCGAEFELNSAGACSPITSGSQTIEDTIAKIINIFSLIVGAVAVIMIIVGGFKYITSGGDSSNISGAKNTILYAIVGLVIVAIAQAIVRFVLNTTP